MNYEEIVGRQRAFFRTNKTLPIKARLGALERLRRAIHFYEEDILAALQCDLGKSSTESYMTEVGTVLSELSYIKKNLPAWAKRQKVPTPLAQFPAKSYTLARPYGLCLIIAPWNYPFMLSIDPLLGAIAAGNCAIVKPSEYAPATAKIVKKIISQCFPPEYITVIEGGREETQALLDQKFDHIFFTGSAAVGQEVLKKAAVHLTPVTLELGGKSPCIIDRSADLDLAAKRIVFGKLLNCGQTCVAPDYVLIDSRVKEPFICSLKKWIGRMYGEDALSRDGYVHMISERHFDRVLRLIDPEKVVIGGESNRENLKIQPTVLDGVSPEDAVMQEEIFGPVLPILTVDSMAEALDFVRDRPAPLALYLFTARCSVKARFTEEVPFGGGCVNDTIVHLATNHMPFGGVGPSGMGAYHGKRSFETFSHQKSIMERSTRLDLPMRYPPYTKLSDRMIRRFLK